MTVEQERIEGLLVKVEETRQIADKQSRAYRTTVIFDDYLTLARMYNGQGMINLGIEFRELISSCASVHSMYGRIVSSLDVDVQDVMQIHAAGNFCCWKMGDRTH